MAKNSFKEFWENRAKMCDLSKSNSITNLEEDGRFQKIKIEKEIEKIDNIFKPSKNKVLLDLGSGIGFWSLRFTMKCKKVIGVDFVDEMNQSLRIKARKLNIYNLELFTCDIIDFKPKIRIDYVFLSGVLLYLTDKRALKLVRNIYNYTKDESEILVRDATGVNGRHIINNIGHIL